MNKLFASVITCSLLFSVVFGNVAFANEDTTTSNISPYDNTLHMTMTVKWGNVRGTPEHINKVSFDGDISVSQGNVELVRKIRFERHDSQKDRIISKQNPVSWTSWIFNKWDGVRVKVDAPLQSRFVIATDAGGLTIPLTKLVTADKPVVLNLGDGREIVLKVNKIHTDPFLIRAYWGGPTPRVIPEPQPKPVEKKVHTNSVKAVKTVSAHEVQPKKEKVSKVDVKSVKPVSKTSKKVLALAMVSNEILPYPYPYHYPRTDFSGALTVMKGAKIDLLRPLLFEPGHGDKIINDSHNNVSWKSFIYGHYDGVLLKARLDQRKPLDDIFVIKFSELEWSRNISLARLYVKGYARFNINHNGRVYHLILQAVHMPFCEAQEVDSVRCLTTEEAKLVPIKSLEDNSDLSFDIVNKEE